MESFLEANLNQLTTDAHFLTAPLRLIWRSILWLAFLFCAPAIFFSFLLFAIFYRGPDKSDTIWFLKWAFGVIAPFASSFWFLLAVMLPRFYRAKRDGHEVNNTFGLHLQAIGAMVFGFVTTAAGMLCVARALYESSDVAWFSGAYMALLGPFLTLGLWRLTHRR